MTKPLDVDLFSSTNYWEDPEALKHRTLASYKRGVKRLARFAVEDLLIPDSRIKNGPERWGYCLEGKTFVVFPVRCPSVHLDTPSDGGAVDTILQVGIFGGLVYG